MFKITLGMARALVFELITRGSTPLGTAGAIRNALDKLEGEFLLLYGDSYLPIDYQQVVKSFQAAACKGMIVVYDNRFGDTGVQNNVALSGDGFVTRYQKGQSELALECVEAGVLSNAGYSPNSWQTRSFRSNMTSIPG